MSERAPLLEPLHLRGVSVRAGEAVLLQEIDLVLRPGELVGLIGPSGAGKSTLIKVLLGLKSASGGTITAGGQPLSALGPIGYVPQDDALHLSLTVRETLDFAAQLRLPELDEETRAARITELCKAVGLDERLDVRIKRLSGGQRKRVSVALELLTEPGVLILDEPTSGLDPGMEAQMMSLFDEVARGGRVVMVATHAMASLRRCAWLIVLVGGRLAYAGPPEGALAWFEVSHHEAIFPALRAHAPPVWGRRWSAAPKPLPSPRPPTAATAPAPATAPTPATPVTAAEAPSAAPNARSAAEAQLAELKARLGKSP